MASDSLPRPTATELLKAVFWNRWGKVVGGLLGVIGIGDFIDAHFAPRFGHTLKAVWDSFYVLPSFSWRTWVMMVCVGLLVVAVHGAYVFAKGYSDKYAALTRYKIEFKVDEVSSRVFLQATSKDTVMIQAKIKLQFENKDIYPWSMKELKTTLHKLEPKIPEITTYVVNDEYMDASGKQSIPREQFEGMLIPGGGVTRWFTYWIWLVIGSDEEIKKPDDLTGAHFLRLSMQASNQNELDSPIFLDWAKATKQNGASIHSFGAQAFRLYEDRRLSPLDE